MTMNVNTEYLGRVKKVPTPSKLSIMKDYLSFHLGKSNSQELTSRYFNIKSLAKQSIEE